MESIQYYGPDAFWDAVCLLGAVFCAYRAIVAKRILSATIYLACISALTSAVIYLLGAGRRHGIIGRGGRPGCAPAGKARY
jgi:hypothetical protein